MMRAAATAATVEWPSSGDRREFFYARYDCGHTSPTRQF
jgi:hypothetical protein